MRVSLILLLMLAVALSCSYLLADFAQYRSTTSPMHVAPVVCVLVAGVSAFGVSYKLREILVALSIAAGIFLDRAQQLAASSMTEYFIHSSWLHFVPPVLVAGAFSLTWGRRAADRFNLTPSSRSVVVVSTSLLAACCSALRLAPVGWLFALIVLLAVSLRPSLAAKLVVFMASVAVVVVVIVGADFRAGVSSSPLFVGLSLMVLLSAALVLWENIEDAIGGAPRSLASVNGSWRT